MRAQGTCPTLSLCASTERRHTVVGAIISAPNCTTHVRRQCALCKKKTTTPPSSSSPTRSEEEVVMSTASSDVNATSSRAAGATDACLLMVGRLGWCQEVAWRVQNALPLGTQSPRLEWSEALGAPQLCARHPFALLLLELASRGQARHAALHVSCFVRYDSKINEKTPIIAVQRSNCTENLSAFGIDDTVECPLTQQAIQRILTKWTSLALWDSFQQIPPAIQNTGPSQGNSTDNKSIRMTTPQQPSLEGVCKATKEGGGVQDSGQTQVVLEKARADLVVRAYCKHSTALVRHSVKERQRRGRIKHCCLNMNSLLPLNPRKRPDMASVLEAAVSYLHLVLPLVSAQHMQQFADYLQSNKNYHRVSKLPKAQKDLWPKSIHALQPALPSSLCGGPVVLLPEPPITHTSMAPPPSHRDVYKPTSIKLIQPRPIIHQTMNPTMEAEPSRWHSHPMPYKARPIPGSTTCTHLQAKHLSYDSEVSAFVPVSSAARRESTATAVAMSSYAPFLPRDVGRAVTPSCLTSSSLSSAVPSVGFYAPAPNEVLRMQRESPFNVHFGLSTLRHLNSAGAVSMEPATLVPACSCKLHISQSQANVASAARGIAPLVCGQSYETMNDYQQAGLPVKGDARGEGPLNYTIHNLQVGPGLSRMPSTTPQQLQCPDGSSSILPTGGHATLLDPQRSQGRGGGAGPSSSHLEWDHEEFIMKLLYSE
ncbi:spermatogenesis- and oogenesis-specific basic helix-loop-helix-containing protein 2 isoform X2 [Petromyzon marinus]|uniref:spermatogenesis- and oogenesis-specific basic helix-loop-helix-containing protein 2 isoform X2 n=1 Tax=Petromyzon marinus TaxID=7757 RepID=UPI003F6FB337